MLQRRYLNSEESTIAWYSESVFGEVFVKVDVFSDFIKGNCEIEDCHHPSCHPVSELASWTHLLVHHNSEPKDRKHHKSSNYDREAA